MASVETFTTLIGRELGVSDWITITQPMIDRFAEISGDKQFIHIDPAAALASPFGGTIAHGFLLLSLFPDLYMTSDAPKFDGAKLTVNAGGNRFRFVSPVRSGKRIRGRFKLLEFSEMESGGYQQIVDFRLEIEGQEKPAAVAEIIVQHFI
jgi:acyl dehydratase